MSDILLGGFTARTGNTSTGSIYSNGTLADCRAGSDGSKPMIITAIYGAVSGFSATRTGTMYVGGSSVGISRPSAGSATDTGWIGSSSWLTSAFAAVTYGYTAMSGRFYFARSSTSGAIGSFDGGGPGFTGVLGMYYRFIEVASAPSFTSITPNSDGDQVTIVLAAPATDGGSAVTGYRIQRATDAGFTVGLTTVSSTGTTLMTGLVPGTTYFYRVTARNGVSDGASILGGPWSGTSSVAQPDPTGLGRRYNGATFESADGKGYFSGTWQTLDGRRYNGSTWEQLGL